LRFVKLMVLLMMIVMLSSSALQAQGDADRRRLDYRISGKWGVGGFASFNKPLFSFGDRFSSGLNKYGVNMSYVSSSQVTLEAEYHHVSQNDGMLETAPFAWSPKGGVKNNYKSIELDPNSSYTNKFNSFVLSALWHFNAGRTMGEGSYSPYIVVGGGFYDHNTVAENIIWPGQAPTDAGALGNDADGNPKPSVNMGTQTDTRTALAGALGLGIEAFLTPTIAVDLRARYHFVLGELRPYTASGWTFEKTFPLQMVDLSAGIKFYFWD